MATHNLSATVTDTLAATDSDTLAVTSIAAAANRVITRRLWENRVPWGSVVDSSTQGPTFSDVTPESTTFTGGVACPPNEITLIQTFSVKIPCRFTGCRIYKAPNATGTAIEVVLWSGVATGTLLASESIATWTVDGGGWQQVDFSPTVDLEVGVTYSIGFHSQDGIYAYSSWVQNGQDAVVWPIVAKTFFETGAGVRSDGNISGNYAAATIAFPVDPATGRRSATNFYIDPQVEWDDPLPAYTGGTAYFDQWTNPDGLTRHPFPFCIWWKDPPYLEAYWDMGFNTMLGGSPVQNPPNGDEYVEIMNGIGNAMDWWPALAFPEPGGNFKPDLLQFLGENPAIDAQVRGYVLWDEPDMVTTHRTPEAFQTMANYMRVRDSTRPIYTTFGYPTVLNQTFFWAPTGASPHFVNDMWRAQANTLDVIGSDFYTLPLGGDRPGLDPADRYGIWVYAEQVGRMRQISDGRKPVFTLIETCQQPGSNTPNDPDPEDVRKAAWAALIAGARGLVFFDHRFASGFVTQDFAAALNNPPMSTMLAALSVRVQSLGAALLSEDLGLVTAYTSSNTSEGPRGGTYGVPLHYTTRTDGTYEYAFVQAIRPGATTATITIPTWASETVDVLDESRSEVVDGGGVITDSFAADYETHLYRRTL